MKEPVKTAEKPKKNLFASAKKVETTKESKSKTISLPVTPELKKTIQEYTDAKSQCKSWEAKKEMAESVIKEKSKKIFLDEYQKSGRNIGSFKLEDITVSVQDRYIKLDENMVSIIESNFPNVIDVKTEYLFNQEILEKYFDEISDALQNAEGIPEEDLNQLIESKETKLVKKGTIDTLATYGERMTDLFKAISPIISVR